MYLLQQQHHHRAEPSKVLLLLRSDHPPRPRLRSRRLWLWLRILGPATAAATPDLHLVQPRLLPLVQAAHLRQRAGRRRLCAVLPARQRQGRGGRLHLHLRDGGVARVGAAEALGGEVDGVGVGGEGRGWSRRRRRRQGGEVCAPGAARGRGGWRGEGFRWRGQRELKKKTKKKKKEEEEEEEYGIAWGRS